MLSSQAITPFIYDHYALTILTCLAIWFGLTILYRITLHPLARFPGPFWARTTHLWQLYRDALSGGTMALCLPALHEKYGPIVRITPRHLHIAIPDFQQTVLLNQNEFTKDPLFYMGMGFDQGLASVININEHRSQRNHFDPLFSTKALRDFNPTIAMVVSNAIAGIRKSAAAQKIVDISDVAGRIVADVGTEYLTGERLNAVVTEEPVPMIEEKKFFVHYLNYARYSPVSAHFVLRLPQALWGPVLPGIASFRNGCQRLLSERGRRQKEQPGSESRYNLLDALLVPDEKKGYTVPDAEAHLDQVLGFLVAALDTSAWAIATSLYFILSLPEIKERVMLEINAIEEGNIDGYAESAYMQAIFRESQRLSPSVVGFLPRIVPPGGAVAGDEMIPAGTIVSTAPFVVNRDPQIFPEPEKFIPERWLGEAGEKNNKWFLAFGRGTRRCIGSKLATITILSSLAMLLRNFDFELYDTDEAAIKPFDHLVAWGAPPVRVRVRAVFQ